MQKVSDQRPLYLGIETINVCNAACVFCVYVQDTRPRAVMSMRMFERILHDYVKAGGGGLSLTPLTGDVLLDPLLTQRLEMARGMSIGNIWFHTNAIRWPKLAEDDRATILSMTNQILVSLGGANSSSYAQAMGVDAWTIVLDALTDMAQRRTRLGAATDIRAILRTLVPPTEEEVNLIRATGVDCVEIDTQFHNWGGAIETLGSAAHIDEGAPRAPCATLFTAPMVLVDGRMTACGCANPEGRELFLGWADQTDVASLWRNLHWLEYVDRFSAGRLSPPCRGCTYYESVDMLSDRRLDNFQLGDNPWNSFDEPPVA